MSDPFLGEIRLFGFNFAPRGWAFCSGQILSIAQNTALFSLLGTTYGGNGTSTFALPDLRGRVFVGQGTLAGGSNYTLGEEAGAENVTLTIQTMPSHRHAIETSSLTGDSTAAANAVYAGVDPTGKTSSQTPLLYGAPGTLVNMASELKPTGGGLPHLNMQPYLVANYCIALNGIYPSRN